MDTVVTEDDLNGVIYDEVVRKIREATKLLDESANDLDAAERWDLASKIDAITRQLASVRLAIQHRKDV